MRTKKSGPRFFKITKTKLLLTVIFFALIMYLAGVPVDLIQENNLSIEVLPSVVVLTLLEIIIGYIIACIVVFLFHKHRRR